ncbi:hypothetical protein VTH06DRAFT_6791 [Thermothelomyces fergusii]
MYSRTLLLAALASSQLAAGETFIGRGQLRTLWNEGDHEDLGCLTDTGLWTTNEALCGTFTGTALDVSTLRTFTLSTATGPCTILGAQFTCGQGNEPAWFGIYVWPNAIPDKDCLRYGQYGLMASRAEGGGPPAPDQDPIEINFSSYSEKGKWVWVTWKAL